MDHTEERITKQLLKIRSGEFDIESIHSLVLCKLNLSGLGCIGECVGLERLDLSQNDITKLYSLAGLSNITHLNLSANRISSLEGLQALDNLESLNLAGNLLGSMESLRSISGLEKLVDLRLQNKPRALSNPICMNSSYKQDVLAIMKTIIVLDGERVSGKGSDLYKMCEDLDTLIKGQQSDASVKEAMPARPWFPPDRLQPSQKFEQTSNLADAESQLKDLLAECHRVQLDATDRINRSKAALDIGVNKQEP